MWGVSLQTAAMLWELLFWTYLANATLLLVHEIDSAYWREWERFHLPGGISGFLLIHIALVALVLYGVHEVAMVTDAAPWFSLGLAAAGVFAFIIHMVFLAKGRDEFRSAVSVGILIATLVVSLVQAAAAVAVIV